MTRQDVLDTIGNLNAEELWARYTKRKLLEMAENIVKETTDVSFLKNQPGLAVAKFLCMIRKDISQNEAYEKIIVC